MTADEYDYIVIGAGSAGCVVAEHLSRNARDTVLLLEAGPDCNNFWIRMPLGYGHSLFNDRVNWMYESEQEQHLHRRRMFVPRGKLVGGSSAINAMVYMRGTPRDYRDWVAAGNDRWGWQEVLATYKRMETHCVEDPDFHGTNGPLYVGSRRQEAHPTAASFLDAARSLQIPPNDDFNGADIEGVGYYHHTIQDGERMSAARAWLRQARQRQNFRLLASALVHRVRIEGRKATGVEFERRGQVHSIRARKEVVLSAGAINSPQLLMLSGIGPARALRSVGVAVQFDLPAVGAHLQDHLAWDMQFRSRVPTWNRQLGSPWARLMAGAQYVLTGSGPLSATTTHAGGFIRSSPRRSFPNLQLYYSPITRDVRPGRRGQMGMPDSYQAFSMSISNVRPASHGDVSLRSASPYEAPAISFNFLSMEVDLQEMIEGAHILRRLASAPPLAAIIEREYLPGSGVQSDQALADDIRARAYSIYHPCGTCRMGADSTDCVVDQELRVHGVEGLRVADASVFPNIVSGNINGPSMMVGQRAGELMTGGH